MRFSINPIDKTISALREEGGWRDAKRRAENTGLKLFTKDTPINSDALRKIPEQTAKKAEIAVIDKGADGELVIVANDPQKIQTAKFIDFLREHGENPRILIAPLSEIKKMWDGYNKEAAKKDDTKTSNEIKGKITKTTLSEVKANIRKISDANKFIGEIGNSAPTTKVLMRIVSSALVLNASDIHIEHTTKEGALIRFRIDGNLRDVVKISRESARLLIHRIKLLSGLKLNISDNSQDGRFTIESGLGDIEVRVSVVPAEFGEAVVMRVLNPNAIAMDLSSLGLRKDDETTILQELKKPTGMMLATGPTGSGKTTTLYALLNKIKTQTVKIITIEDPIEYHIKGIEQTQIDPESGYTFATGLNSILRQDPDIILVGEIRNKETAETALQAALTGHLVFSTLHANNAAGAIPRLIDLGVNPAIIGPALSMVISQRLVRRLCPKGKKEEKIDDELRKKINNFLEGLPKHVPHENIEIKLYSAVGCDECDDGFLGRTAIVELLQINNEIEGLIKKGATEGEIQKFAVEKQEMVLIQQDGILKAINGITTLSEVERATGPIAW